jgi:hypothetical protein
MHSSSKVSGQNPAGMPTKVTNQKQHSPAAPVSVSPGAQTQPSAEIIQGEANSEAHKEHWSVRFLAFVAAIGGFVAAIFAGAQWWIAWDTEIVANQAIIVSNSFRLVTLSDASEKPRRWLMSPLIENTGNTPTRNLRYKIAIGLCSGDDPTKDSLDKRLQWRGAPESAFVRNIIGPKTEIAGSNIIIANNTFNCRWDANAIGLVKFRDFFNYLHLVEFCTLIHLPPVDFQNYPIGQPIKAQGQACAYHNCTDEECGTDWRERAK